MDLKLLFDSSVPAEGQRWTVTGISSSIRRVWWSSASFRWRARGFAWFAALWTQFSERALLWV